jgi:hypothetical protein
VKAPRPFRLSGAREAGVVAQAVAFITDVDDVAVVQEAIDENRHHHLVTEDLAPLFEALVAG